MKRRFVPLKSLLNAVERAKKLKDLEIAKSLELNYTKKNKNSKDNSSNKKNKWI